MTAFSKNTLVFSRATNPLPPNKSTEVIVFFDGKELKTIDYTGAIAPLVSPSTVIVQGTDKEHLKAVEQKLTKLINSTQSDLQLNIVEALMALEEFKKTQASSDSASQAKIYALEQQLVQSLNQVSAVTDATISHAEAISGLSSNVQTLLKNFTASINLKVSKQELADAVKAVKESIPPEIEVEAGAVTHGKKDDLSVRKIGNTYIIDLELKKQKDGNVHYSSGLSEDAVKQLIAQFAPTMTLVSSGGTVVITPIHHGYNLEVAGSPPIITPIAITAFTGGSTHEIGSTVNSVSLAWSYNYNPDTSQSLNQGIGSVPLSAFAYTYTNPITANVTFTLSATDSVHGSTSANTSVNFINRRYFGLFGTDAVLTSSDIVALSGELSDSRSKSFNSYPCSGNRFVFAYPSRLGVATVRDGNGFIMQDWYTGTSPYTVNVTNSFGYTEAYIVYQTYNRYNGSPTLVFS